MTSLLVCTVPHPPLTLYFELYASKTSVLWNFFYQSNRTAHLRWVLLPIKPWGRFASKLSTRTILSYHLLANLCQQARYPDKFRFKDPILSTSYQYRPIRRSQLMQSYINKQARSMFGLSFTLLAKPVAIWKNKSRDASVRRLGPKFSGGISRCDIHTENIDDAEPVTLIFGAPSTYLERSMEHFEPSCQANDNARLPSARISTFLPPTMTPTLFHQDLTHASQTTTQSHSEIDGGSFIEMETSPYLSTMSFPPISHWYEDDCRRTRPNVPVPTLSLPSSLQALALHSPIPEKKKSSSPWWAHFLSYLLPDGLMPNWFHTSKSQPLTCRKT